MRVDVREVYFDNEMTFVSPYRRAVNVKGEVIKKYEEDINTMKNILNDFTELMSKSIKELGSVPKERNYWKTYEYLETIGKDLLEEFNSKHENYELAINGVIPKAITTDEAFPEEYMELIPTCGVKIIPSFTVDVWDVRTVNDKHTLGMGCIIYLKGMKDHA